MKKILSLVMILGSLEAMATCNVILNKTDGDLLKYSHQNYPIAHYLPQGHDISIVAQGIKDPGKMEGWDYYIEGSNINRRPERTAFGPDIVFDMALTLKDRSGKVIKQIIYNEAVTQEPSGENMQEAYKKLFKILRDQEDCRSGKLTASAVGIVGKSALCNSNASSINDEILELDSYLQQQEE